MKRALRLLAATLVALAVAGAATYAYLNSKLSRFAATAFGSGVSTVDIAVGTSPKAVAALLAKHGVVEDADLLYGYLRRERLGPSLRAGEYEFELPLSPIQVIEKLSRGHVKLYRFTIPEGLRVDEILPIIAESDLHPPLSTLRKLASDAAFARKLGVPAPSFEGFLFPDTYSFPRGTTAEQVFEKLVSRALEEISKAPRAAGIDLSTLQVATLASIVEKETGAPEERPRIACVFHNRLRQGIKLQTDPTVLYAKMLTTGAFSKNITKRDLEAEHPYNTYAVKGLPPGPIASAGAAAIHAALNPLSCNDLFFVSKNDGTHVFCPDLKCHEANVEKWQRAFFRKRDARPSSPP